jgi:hypothetical protein
VLLLHSCQKADTQLWRQMRIKRGGRLTTIRWRGTVGTARVSEPCTEVYILMKPEWDGKDYPSQYAIPGGVPGAVRVYGDAGCIGCMTV